MDRLSPYHVENVASGEATTQPKVTNVHVNPNFKNNKNLVIHINPRMHQIRKIHINPKMMKDIAPLAESNARENPPPVMERVSCEEIEHSQPKIQKSIHVNPKLMSKFSSTARENPMSGSALCSENHVTTGAKINKNVSADNKTLKKTPSPRLLSLSRRKLVRIAPNVKPATILPSPNSLKRLNKKSLTACSFSNKIAIPLSLAKFNSPKKTYKASAYKIDRTSVEPRKRKKIRIPETRIGNVNKGLVAIGGVMYRSSRTQLVRSGASSSTNKKLIAPVRTTKGEAFLKSKNGKKLQRLYTTKDDSVVTRYMISRNSFNQRTIIKKVPNSVVQSSHKNVISYKAKQRSLQILRDKLRKNYIPCLLYQRFGYCAKQAKGTCPKLHDKKQVSLCKNFLQGKCLLDKCPLSHDIGPEKMPTCKYFLEGCCIRDACPYLHVKVSANTPLCPQFLRGYCAEGSKCKQRHANICPEFEKSGKCAKGKYCPYPHKLKSTSARVTKSTRVVTKNKRAISSSKRSSNESRPAVTEPVTDNSRKRYYDKAAPTDKQLAEMRESILKKMQSAKVALGHCENCEETVSEKDDRIIDEEVTRETNLDVRPKRAPIGPLPAYIPIN